MEEEMKTEFKVVRDEEVAFTKKINKLFAEGWFMEADTYRVFEYCGRLFFSILMFRDFKEEKK